MRTSHAPTARDLLNMFLVIAILIVCASLEIVERLSRKAKNAGLRLVDITEEYGSGSDTD